MKEMKISSLSLLLTVAVLTCLSRHVNSATRPSKFVSWRRDVRNSSVITVYTDELQEIDVGWPPLTRIEIVGFHDVSINFTCFVNPLREEDHITEVLFWFGTTRDGMKGECYELKGSEFNRKVTVIRGRNIPVTLSFDHQRGAQAVLHRIPSSMSLDEIKFSCGVGNRQGWVDSNDVEIFDYRRQFPRATVTFNETESELDPEIKHFFHCLRPGSRTTERNDPKAVVNFVWKYCSDIALKDCKNISDIREPDWGVQLLRNGTMYWSNVPRKVVAILQSNRLKCSIGNQDIALYRRPMTFKNSSSRSSERNGKNKSKRIYPESTPHSIEVLSGDTEPFFLPLIHEDDKNVKPTWRQGNRTLTELKKGESPDGKCRFRQFSNVPVCQGPFKENVTSVEVEIETVVSSSRRKRSVEKRTLQYDIKRVDFGPEIGEQMPDTVFMMDGSNASIICRFEEPETVISMLSIRGYSLDFNTQETLEEDIDYQNGLCSDVMSPIRASVNATRPKYGQLVEYKLENVVYRDSSHNNLSSDHYITCLGYREKKWVRRQIMLTVLPNPQITGINNRTADDEEKLAFYVEVKNEDEIRNIGAKVTVVWKLDGRPLKKQHSPVAFQFIDYRVLENTFLISTTKYHLGSSETFLLMKAVEK